MFGKSALLESIRVDLSAGGERFFIRGRRILEKGWLSFYGRYETTEEVILPPLKEGEEIPVKEVIFEEKETEPPPRYNPASIIKEMEEIGIGTKATRAIILQHLYERNYIFGSQIQVTELGMKVVDALEKYCPEIVSEELTAHFEREMELIQEERRDKDEVISEGRAELNKILMKFREHQLEIGKVLGEAYKRTRQEQRVVGKCPACGGDLKIIVSRQTRKRFVGCSNYVNGCRTSFPLPQVGAVIPLGKTCEQCETPIIQIDRAGTRPYRMCLDPNCSSKAGWGKRKAPKELKDPQRKA